MVALLSCAACLMLGLTLALESSCLPGQLRYIIHFSHDFEYDAVVLPLRPIANRFGGCFLFGLWPRFCVLVCLWLFASLFPLAKRKSGWGICGSSFFGVVVFRLLFYRFAYSEDFFVLVQCFDCLLTC